MKRQPNFVQRLTAPRRFAVALAAGVAAYLARTVLDLGGSGFLVAWDVGASAYLAIAWTIIARSNPTDTRLHARAQDVGARVIFVIVLVAALTSVVAITFLLSDVKDLEGAAKAAHILLAAVALLSSWLLIHTLYTFHYARYFYSTPEDAKADRRGLEFPGGADPDYYDFAYYSFVVGMTSQVSDVSISGHRMRRVTLVHGILSFVFNVAVLALSVNIIVNVLG